jgi:hypothetical protein
MVDFTPERVRSGVATLLAAKRVGRKLRGHLQSHGLTGIRARHCDGRACMVEKQEALEVLAGELSRDPTRSRAAKPRPQTALTWPRAPRCQTSIKRSGLA